MLAMGDHSPHLDRYATSQPIRAVGPLHAPEPRHDGASHALPCYCRWWSANAYHGDLLRRLVLGSSFEIRISRAQCVGSWAGTPGSGYHTDVPLHILPSSSLTRHMPLL